MIPSLVVSVQFIVLRLSHRDDGNARMIQAKNAPTISPASLGVKLADATPQAEYFLHRPVVGGIVHPAQFYLTVLDEHLKLLVAVSPSMRGSTMLSPPFSAEGSPRECR